MQLQTLASPGDPLRMPSAAEAAAARAQPLEIHVQVLTSQAELSALAAEWERVHADAAVCSVFTSWAWQFAWWEIYGRGQPLRIAVAYRGHWVVGILPLYIQSSTALGLPVKRLRLLGAGGDTSPDDLGPILARGHESAAARALADATLQIKGFDVLDLTDVDSHSPFPPALQAAAQRADIACTLGRSQKIAYLELPATWEAYLASVSGHRRSRIGSARRKLAAAHATRFFVWKDEASLGQAVGRLALLHRKRWAGASSSFATQDYFDLHHAAMRECLQRDWLRLYCLEIAGEVSAIIYCYRFRRQVFMMQCGFDPAYGKFSPGSVLLGHAIEHAIGEGSIAFDFLRGEHDYKDLLASANRETVALTAMRPTLGATAYRAKNAYRLAKATALGMASALRS